MPFPLGKTGVLHCGQGLGGGPQLDTGRGMCYIRKDRRGTRLGCLTARVAEPSVGAAVHSPAEMEQGCP